MGFVGQFWATGGLATHSDLGFQSNISPQGAQIWLIFHFANLYFVDRIDDMNGQSSISISFMSLLVGASGHRCHSLGTRLTTAAVEVQKN